MQKLALAIFIFAGFFLTACGGGGSCGTVSIMASRYPSGATLAASNGFPLAPISACQTNTGQAGGTYSSITYEANIDSMVAIDSGGTHTFAFTSGGSGCGTSKSGADVWTDAASSLAMNSNVTTTTLQLQIGSSTVYLNCNLTGNF